MAAGYLQASTISQNCNQSMSSKKTLKPFFLFYIVNLNTSHVFLENITKFRTEKSQTTLRTMIFYIVVKLLIFITVPFFSVLYSEFINTSHVFLDNITNI